MDSSDETYNGYDIGIQYERYFPAIGSYCIMFQVSKGEKHFSLSCRLSKFMVSDGLVKIDDVNSILRATGINQIQEMIDSDQFEDRKTYICEASLNEECWQCRNVSNRMS